MVHLLLLSQLAASFNLNAMLSDQNYLRSLLLPLILLLSLSKLLLDGALLANVQPRVNSIVDFHSPINQLEPIIPNYCNESKLIEQSGLIRAPMGQFLGFPCSNEFYHCRWQSDGYRTYKKNCRAGLVYDVLGTQNCNYDYNVKGCAMGPSGGGVANCTAKDLFECPLSEDCVPLSKRCDGNYDCVLEEDEQNCPMCKPTHFPCVVSEQCIPLGQRCNGIRECQDGTDELECENCGAGKFLCRKSGKCIAAKERCDGFAQCPHGEDELLCKKARIVLGPRMFVCESGKHQIPQQNVCDGVVHCPDDASDEKYCQVGTATEAMRPMGGGTVPSPNAPPNQLATPATNQNPKIAFDQPMNTGKHGPWVGASEGKPLLTLANQPTHIADRAWEETFPILNIGPMRKAAERRDGNAKVQETLPKMTKMMKNLEKLSSNGTNRLMVEMPRERKPEQENTERLQQQTEDGAKTLVEGDFQPGVWNGSALQQQNNPYADEWYRKQQQNGATNGGAFQQKMEQNNLIQEEGDQFRWTKFDGQFSKTNAMAQPQPMAIGGQQQFEQRRAIKEEEGTTGGEELKKWDGEAGSTAEPNRTAQQPQAAAAERGQLQQGAEGGKQQRTGSGVAEATATGTTNEQQQGERWETKVPPLLMSTVGTVGSATEDGKGVSSREMRRVSPTRFQEFPSQSMATFVSVAEDQQKMSTVDDAKATEGVTSERPELAEGGNCDSNGLGTEGLGEEVTGSIEDQQKQQEQKQQQQQAVTGTEQRQQTKGDGRRAEQRQMEEQRRESEDRTKPTTANSAKEEQQQLNTQFAESAGGEGMALSMGKDSEEQEQRAILQRLYSKYGSNARDLLRRVENLLLLAEDGMMSTKKLENELNSSRKSQKMKRRQAEEDDALIRRYLAQIMDTDGKKIEPK